MKTKILLLALTLFAIVLTGCNTTPHKNIIKVGYLPMVSSLTHFVAVENGYYKDEGLEVQAQEITTSNLIAQELVAGHIDVAIELSIIPLLNQLENHQMLQRYFPSAALRAKMVLTGFWYNQILKL